MDEFLPDWRERCDENAALRARLEACERDAEHLRMQIGYIVAELQQRGDDRSLPEIVETAAKATAVRSAP